MYRLLLPVVVALAACSAESLSVNLGDTTVELDVYSGLPNPRWQLTPQETGQLEDRLNGLPETNAVEIPGQLGYRGFRIQDENGSRLTVTNSGYVVMHHASGDTFYRDAKKIELWLKQNAEARGHGKLLMEAQ
jgi:hypothetical protein